MAKAKKKKAAKKTVKKKTVKKVVKKAAKKKAAPKKVKKAKKAATKKKAAKKVVKKIFKSAEILKTNPTSFQEEPFLKEKGLSARYLVVSMYKVIYVVKGKTVTITDVFNTNQHPSEMNK